MDSSKWFAARQLNREVRRPGGRYDAALPPWPRQFGILFPIHFLRNLRALNYSGVTTTLSFGKASNVALSIFR